jgi:mannonate dehydratase
VPIYPSTRGRDEHEIADSIRRLLEEGYYHIRCQFSTSTGIDEARKPAGTPPGAYFEPRQTLHRLPKLFEHLRREIGEKVELMYDVHERFAPIDAVWLAKALEPYRLFFLEDLLAPEDLEWFANVRAVCATPMAMGELFNNPREITPLIAGRLIDFIRCHVSQLGGATPALKVAHLAAAFGVRTAWHGPVDVSPVGMAANVHLSMASHNCGLLEWAGPADRPDLEHEIFPGLPRVERGHVRPNDRPGWGIDFDEELAAKYPCVDEVPTWTVSRLPDGTIWRP